MHMLPNLKIDVPDPSEYEPPRVERVLTSDELMREVQYAGGASTDEIPLCMDVPCIG